MVRLPHLMMYPARPISPERSGISFVGGTPGGKQVAHVPCIGLGGAWITTTGVSVDRTARTDPINEPLWIPA